MLKSDGHWRCDGRSLTCDQTLAGVPGGQGMDAVRRVRDLISSVFDGDGVPSSHVRYVGHRVGPVSVVTDVRLLRFSFRILKMQTGTQRRVGL